MYQNLVNGVWSIQARAFAIAYTPFSHNFWLLEAPDGQIADQLHGLAVDPVTGATKAIGSSRHLLQAVSDPQITWSLQPGQHVICCASGPESIVRERWNCALNALPVINALAIPYPNLWEHGYKPNSNTIFNTLGRIMGFADPAHLLPTLAPGVSLVVSDEIIEKFCYTPVHPDPPQRYA